MATPFFLAGSRSNADSDDAMSDASNFEHLCSADTAGTPPKEIHHWYGKLYLAFSLARSIVREVGPDTTADELDVHLSKSQRFSPENFDD